MTCKTLECSGCGCKFEASSERHYVARDEGPGGFLCPPETKLYDAFDCPYCGCQVIVQERKRPYRDATSETQTNIKKGEYKNDKS